MMFANDNLPTTSKQKDGRCNNLRHKIPYRLLGRRSMGTKRLVLSSKVLLSAIPTHNCDVVLTFPSNTKDTTLMWLLARLKSRKPALTVSVRHHSNSGIYGFYLTADYDSLLQGAEELAILKPLKTEYGGGMKEFAFEDQDCFAGVEDEGTFLSSQERQSIVLQFLNDLRATKDDVLNGITLVESQPIVPLLKTKKVISQVFPLHKSNDLKELSQTWVQALFSPQPLDLVRRYFGVKIALYFAYLGHYTTWLVIPAFIGLLIFLLQGTDQFMEDVFFLVFAFFNVIWASLYLKFWNRASTEFSYRLGTLEKKDDLLKDPRPLFKGELEKSSVTGHMEPTYPAWKRSLFFYTITAPIIGLCLLLVFFAMLLCFEMQEWVNELIKSSDLPYVFSFGPKILLAVVVSILDEIYKQIALWLTDKENYRLEESFETNLIIKLVLFQFVNSFLSLFYIGFYLGDMDRLRDQLAALLITRQVLGNVKETLMPYVIWKAKLYTFGYRIATKMSPASVEKEVRRMTTRKRSLVHSGSSSSSGITLRGSGEKAAASNNSRKLKQSDDESSTVTDEEDEGIPSLTQAEVESAMKKYEDTLDDYLEMCIQFGYITLFSSAFPLAALCALVNNVIEIRSDAFKLCLTYQRPFGQRVENIGIWQDVLQYMAILAVIVNCILMSTMGVVSRLVPGLSPTVSFLVLVVIEHLLITLKLAIARAIPDMPHTISTEMAKLEYQRREALKKLESQVTPTLTSSHMNPNIALKREVEGAASKESALSSSQSFNQTSSFMSSSSVITPSSFSEGTHFSNSCIPQTTSAAPTATVLKPDACSTKSSHGSISSKKPTPTAAEFSSSSSSSLPSATAACELTADRVVTAAMQPVIGDKVDKQSRHEVSGSLPPSHPSRAHPLRSNLVLKDDGKQQYRKENVGQRYLRRSLQLDARRGVSDPVSSAVSMALRLHHSRDAKGKCPSSNDDDSVRSELSKHSSDSAETGKERRHDILRRSLHNIAQREELRRTASFKHDKRAGDAVEVPTTNNPHPNLSARLLASSRPRSGGSYYSSQLLSNRTRSRSSENISEPSYSLRQTEKPSFSTNRQTKQLDRFGLSSKELRASPSKQPEQSVVKSSAPSTTIAGKTPSEILSKNTKPSSSTSSEVTAVAVSGDDTTSESQSPTPTATSSSPKDSENECIITTSECSPAIPRAVRDSSRQPLSISTISIKRN